MPEIVEFSCGTGVGNSTPQSHTFKTSTSGNTLIIFCDGSSTGTVTIGGQNAYLWSGMQDSWIYRNAPSSSSFSVTANNGVGYTWAVYELRGFVGPYVGTPNGNPTATGSDTTLSLYNTLTRVPNGALLLTAAHFYNNLTGVTITERPMNATNDAQFSSDGSTSDVWSTYDHIYGSGASTRATYTWTPSGNSVTTNFGLFYAGRTLYPNSATNSAISYAAYTAEKAATWSGANTGSTTLSNIAKDAAATVSFWSSDPAHNSATWPAIDSDPGYAVSVEVTSTTNMQAANVYPYNGVTLFRASSSGGTKAGGSTPAVYTSTQYWGFSTTGIKLVTGGSAGGLNTCSDPASDDTVLMMIQAQQNGSHAVGSITFDDSDTYFFSPELVVPGTRNTVPRETAPRSVPPASVSQSSRW